MKRYLIAIALCAATLQAQTPPIGYTPFYGFGKWAQGANPGATALNAFFTRVDSMLYMGYVGSKRFRDSSTASVRIYDYLVNRDTAKAWLNRSISGDRFSVSQRVRSLGRRESDIYTGLEVMSKGLDSVLSYLRVTPDAIRFGLAGGTSWLLGLDTMIFYSTGSPIVSFLGGSVAGMKLAATLAGPYFGPGAAGIGYRATGEMPDTALVMRGKAYFFENSQPGWMMRLLDSAGHGGMLELGVQSYDPYFNTKNRIHLRGTGDLGGIGFDDDGNATNYGTLTHPSGFFQFSQGLNVTGTMRATSQTNPASGAGLELLYSGGIASILPYDRSGGTYKELDIYGNPIVFSTAGIEAMKIIYGANPKVGIGLTPSASDSLLQVNLGGHFLRGLLVDDKTKLTGLVETGGTLQITGQTNPTAGAGIEILYAGAGYIMAFDRGASAYKPLDLLGNPLTLSSTSGVIATSQGAAFVPYHLKIGTTAMTQLDSAKAASNNLRFWNGATAYNAVDAAGISPSQFIWSDGTNLAASGYGSSSFAPTSHSHAWADITSGLPTTLSGYGITDGARWRGYGTSDPASGNAEGDLFYRTDLTVLRVYANGAWRDA